MTIFIYAFQKSSSLTLRALQTTSASRDAAGAGPFFVARAQACKVRSGTGSRATCALLQRHRQHSPNHKATMKKAMMGNKTKFHAWCAIHLHAWCYGKWQCKLQRIYTLSLFSFQFFFSFFCFVCAHRLGCPPSPQQAQQPQTPGRRPSPAPHAASGRHLSSVGTAHNCWTHETVAAGLQGSASVRRSLESSGALAAAGYPPLEAASPPANPRPLTPTYNL